MEKSNKTEALKEYAKKYDEYIQKLNELYEESEKLSQELKLSNTPDITKKIEQNLNKCYDLQFKVDKLMKLTEFLKLDTNND